MFHYPEPLAKLIDELQKLPTIGTKTAQRIAMHILRRPDEDAKELGKAIAEVNDRIVYCSICGGIADSDPCRILQRSPARSERGMCC